MRIILNLVPVVDFLFQVKVWNLDNAELLSSSRIDEDTVILGVLEESVVCLSGSGWVRMFDPVRGTQSVQAELKPLAGRQKALISVTLEKHQKVLVVSEEGFIYQVRFTDSVLFRPLSLHSPPQLPMFIDYYY